MCFLTCASNRGLSINYDKIKFLTFVEGRFNLLIWYYKLLEALTHKPKTLIDFVDDSTLHRS